MLPALKFLSFVVVLWRRGSREEAFLNTSEEGGAGCSLVTWFHRNRLFLWNLCFCEIMWPKSILPSLHKLFCLKTYLLKMWLCNRLNKLVRKTPFENISPQDELESWRKIARNYLAQCFFRYLAGAAVSVYSINQMLFIKSIIRNDT